MKIPCENCITLGTCKGVMNNQNPYGLIAALEKCSLLNEFLEINSTSRIDLNVISTKLKRGQFNRKLAELSKYISYSKISAITSDDWK